MYHALKFRDIPKLDKTWESVVNPNYKIFTKIGYSLSRIAGIKPKLVVLQAKLLIIYSIMKRKTFQT